jgi:hypothetical protein
VDRRVQIDFAERTFVMASDGAVGRRWPLSHAQLLPPDWVAQPVLGGERNGIKWELNRVYDPAGHLVHEWTFWEVRHVLDDDPAPRAVTYDEVAPSGVSFRDFTRLTTPLAQVERWLAAKAKAKKRRVAFVPRHELART